MKLEVWLKGLISAAVTGGASSVAVLIVDPTTYNLEEGFSKLGTVALVAAIAGVANYLKKSPVPGK